MVLWLCTFKSTRCAFHFHIANAFRSQSIAPRLCEVDVYVSVCLHVCVLECVPSNLIMIVSYSDFETSFECAAKNMERNFPHLKRMNECKCN